MQHFENIVVGKPIVPLWELVAFSERDYEEKEKAITYFTEERSIAKILVELGVVKSISEVRRNKPNFCEPLNKLDCGYIKWGKQKFWLVVGE